MREGRGEDMPEDEVSGCAAAREEGGFDSQRSKLKRMTRRG